MPAVDGPTSIVFRVSPRPATNNATTARQARVAAADGEWLDRLSGERFSARGGWLAFSVPPRWGRVLLREPAPS